MLHLADECMHLLFAGADDFLVDVASKDNTQLQAEEAWCLSITVSNAAKTRQRMQTHDT